PAMGYWYSANEATRTRSPAMTDPRYLARFRFRKMDPCRRTANIIRQIRLTSFQNVSGSKAKILLGGTSCRRKLSADTSRVAGMNRAEVQTARPKPLPGGMASPQA